MYNFKFADIGEGIHEGIIHQWLVKEGDAIKDGQTLFLVETDKVTAEIPSPVNGKVHQILFEVGQTVNVGDVVVVLDDGSESVASTAEVKPEAKETVNVEERGSTSVVGEIEVSSNVIASSEEQLTHTETVDTKRKVLATPVARQMAKVLNVDITTLKGSGTNGRIMKDDIQKAHDQISQSKAADQVKLVDPSVGTKSEGQQVASQEVRGAGLVEERVKMTMMRKTIAKNMTLSKFTIPHTACMDEVDVTALVAYRSQLNEKLSLEGEKLTYMPFILKAIAIALKHHSIVNSSLDTQTDEIVLKKYYNIGIATDTPDGLMVPVLKRADQLSIRELASEVKRLSQAAKDKTLTLKEMENGTFTITNYGAIGAIYGVPVIKFPEAAILGIGTIYKKPAIGKEGEFVVQDALPLSLSFDHRIVDGADAGRFLQTIKKLLSDPDLLLIS